MLEKQNWLERKKKVNRNFEPPDLASELALLDLSYS